MGKPWIYKRKQVVADSCVGAGALHPEFWMGPCFCISNCKITKSAVQKIRLSFWLKISIHICLTLLGGIRIAYILFSFLTAEYWGWNWFIISNSKMIRIVACKCINLKQSITHAREYCIYDLCSVPSLFNSKNVYGWSQMLSG